MLSFSEILRETNKFRDKTKELMDLKRQQNYSASFHFSKGLLNSLLKETTQKDILPIHEYLARWQGVIRDYNEQGAQSCLQWEVFTAAISGCEEFLKRELIEELEKQGRDMDSVDEYNAESTVFIKSDTFLDIIGRYVEGLVEQMTEQLQKLKVVQTEKLQTERRLQLSKKANEQALDM